jgi:ubiquinone/menaquinone biosynthesis C-methylase UbiE
VNDTLSFDYEAAQWGSDDVHPGDRSIAAYRIDEALRFLPREGRLLEIGCGGGRMLRAVEQVRAELSLCGIDVSRSALRRAAERSPAIEFRLVQDPQAALPAGDAEFDAVLILDVLEHVADPPRLLAEVARVLRPGGILHLHVPCEGDALSLWHWVPGQGGAASCKRRLAGHVQRFRRREVLELLEASGFETLRVRHSLHILGNLADLAAFALLALRLRYGAEGKTLTTTGDLMAGSGRSAGLVRFVDAALWYEARALGAIPSWGLHVSARRRLAVEC